MGRGGRGARRGEGEGGLNSGRTGVLARLACVILSIGAVACTLLALRQSRLQAAHELADTQLRIRAQDEALWRLRARIASRVTPERVADLARAVSPLHPVMPSGRTTRMAAEESAVTPVRGEAIRPRRDP